MMGVEGGTDIKVHAIRGAYHGGPDGALAHLTNLDQL
jgi:hypothetical protein